MSPVLCGIHTEHHALFFSIVCTLFFHRAILTVPTSLHSCSDSILIAAVTPTALLEGERACFRLASLVLPEARR